MQTERHLTNEQFEQLGDIKRQTPSTIKCFLILFVVLHL